MTVLNRETATPAMRKGSNMKNHSIKQNICSGFTLLELIIVVVVITVLVSIAYPSYVDYVYQARRSDGQQALMDAVNRQEQFFLDHNGYATTLAAAGVSATSSEGYYNINLANVGCGSPPCYIFTATAVAPQDGDTACTPMTIRTDGTKTPANCW